MRVLVQRIQDQLEQRESLRQRVRAELPGLVQVLVQEFGARQVTVFGSVVRGFDTDSPDLDLMVEGIPRDRFAHAMGRLTLLSPLPVDLVPAEWGRPDIVARAREEGEVLYVAR
ncbi:MAG: nucleotidyltransferase domain-containing protein [Polyangia bacterium]|jgi:predicted nucleotidyltransferase|nr:nucleotidyltransferase domain-containing protein [Polyangia bacterium]